MAKKGVIVYDFETNGFWSPLNQPIQVCCKVYEHGECVHVYKEYIKCAAFLNPTITELTGITDDLLRERGISLELAFFELKKLFLKYKGYLVVGHNLLSFDNKFFNYYMQYFKYGFELKNSDCFDTMCEHRAIVCIGDSYDKSILRGDFHSLYSNKRVSGCKLNEVAEHFKIDLSCFKLHDAEGDVDLTYKIYLHQSNNVVAAKKVKKHVVIEVVAPFSREIVALVNSKVKKGYNV